MDDRQKEKLFNVIIYFLKNTKKCFKLKLLKLLYFLDFEHYRQTGRSVTGLDYYAWKNGPVPKDIFKAIDNPEEFDGLENYVTSFKKDFDDDTGSMTVIKPKKIFNPKLFSKRELELLKNFSEIFRDTTANQMIETSHFINLPWQKTRKEKGDNQRIEYNYALDNKEDSISLEEVEERNKIREETISYLESL